MQNASGGVPGAFLLLLLGNGCWSAQAPALPRRVANSQSVPTFDPEKGPLPRATDARVGTEVHRVILVFHHQVFDGWSVKLLAAELSALYAAALRGEPAALPATALP